MFKSRSILWTVVATIVSIILNKMGFEVEKDSILAILLDPAVHATIIAIGNIFFRFITTKPLREKKRLME